MEQMFFIAWLGSIFILCFYFSIFDFLSVLDACVCVCVESDCEKVLGLFVDTTSWNMLVLSGRRPCIYCERLQIAALHSAVWEKKQFLFMVYIIFWSPLLQQIPNKGYSLSGPQLVLNFNLIPSDYLKS